VTPESVAAIPPEVAAPPPPAPQRRSQPHAFRLLDQGEERREEKKKPAKKPRRAKRRGPWLKRLVLVLLVAALGGGGYWYFVLKNPGKRPPWAGLVDKAKKLVSGSTQPPARRPAPPPRQTSARAPTPPPAAPTSTPPAPPAAPGPLPVAQPQPVAASPFARLDRLSDSLARVVRNFQDRATLFDGGRMDCNGLASGLVAVENMWITYNGERKARLTTLDQPRVLRDQSLYASVDAVSRRFDNSGCPRP
jgi:hypothetical protein